MCYGVCLSLSLTLCFLYSEVLCGQDTSCWDFKWEQEVNGERRFGASLLFKKAGNLM